MNNYTLVGAVSKETGISRKKRRFISLNPRLKKSAQEFLEREDNICMMPGKRDTKKRDGVQVQKRILCGYMYNSYHKYLAENPAITMSHATFHRW